MIDNDLGWRRGRGKWKSPVRTRRTRMMVMRMV